MDANPAPFRGRGASLDNEFEARRRRVSVELHTVDKLIADANSALRKSTSYVQRTPQLPNLRHERHELAVEGSSIASQEKFETRRRQISLNIRSVEDVVKKANEHMHVKTLDAAARHGNVLSSNPLHGRNGPASFKPRINGTGMSNPHPFYL